VTDMASILLLVLFEGEWENGCQEKGCCFQPGLLCFFYHLSVVGCRLLNVDVDCPLCLSRWKMLIKLVVGVSVTEC